MKGFFILLISVAILILAGWQTVGHSATPQLQLQPELQLQPKPTIITDIEGVWYSFPVGLVVQVHGDGIADFGVDADGTPTGYQAVTWFEEGKLFVQFSNYDGKTDLCRTAIGIYQVQQRSDGIIRFVTIDDPCQFRVDALSGRADLGFELAFHAVSF
jgi:hypothetical protein